MPVARLKTHVGPQLNHSQNTDKNSYSSCRPSPCNACKLCHCVADQPEMEDKFLNSEL